MGEPFSTTLFDYRRAESEFSDALCDAGFGDFTSIGGDDYDNSIELYGVSNEARMTEAAQRLLFDAGFSKAYVNHEDGWETHYTWSKEFAVQPGWRRRYVKDPTTATTRMIGGDLPEERGYFEINYWPDGWGDQEHGRCAEWLKSGYMRIVPDPQGARSVVGK